jgi:hypothetical protein
MSNLGKTLSFVFVALFLTSVGLPSLTLGQPSWNTQIVDNHGSYGNLAIDSNGNPHIV